MRHLCILFFTLASLGLTACGGGTSPAAREGVYVSIAPLKYIVHQIAGAQFPVEVLVPETTSPETYEPTVQQIKGLSRADAYISIGLIDFEQALEGRIGSIAPQTILLDLSQGLELLEGDCGHHHDDHGHHHAVDPHIWLSPAYVKTFAGRITELLSELVPDSAQVYRQRQARFSGRVDSLDRHIREKLAATHRRSFAIGHPSLTYYAHDYGLQQISIETDGKEPSVRMMKILVDSLGGQGIRAVLYQRQTSDAAARTIAREIGGRAIEFDPLAYDWPRNLYRLTDTLHAILND